MTHSTKQSAYQYKLLSITMNEGTILRPGKLTVLVGPNNAGKSRVLKEIANQTTRQDTPPSVMISAVGVDYPPTLSDLRNSYAVDRYQEEGGAWSFRTLHPDLTSEFRLNSGDWPRHHEQAFAGAGGRGFEKFFANEFGRAMVAFLTTETRLRLVQAGDSPAENRQAASLLQCLYNAGSSAEKKISDLVKGTFGLEVKLDFTIPQRLRLRVGSDFSTLPSDPRDARDPMQEYDSLDEQGDGIRSFVGISVALLTLNRGLFLIDEPEAFLHPPQAYKIGALIADQTDQSRQIILATHSADILRGILSRTQDVDIVRIDRVGNVNSFRHLPLGRLKEIINDPLLTSARVLDGLFYSAAVVVEADSDARFYHAASVKRAPHLGIHFVNADNKQTVPRILQLYRDMGVRSAGIVDLDVLNDRTELDKSLDSLGFFESERTGLLAMQQRIAQAVKELPPQERLNQVQTKLREVTAKIEETIGRVFQTPEDERRAKDAILRELESRFRELSEMTKVWKELKQSGIKILSQSAAADFLDIWKACADRGFFINPTGELESMLVEYGIPWTNDKKRWITQALQLVPRLDVDDEKYPWQFLRSIHKHLRPTES